MKWTWHFYVFFQSCILKRGVSLRLSSWLYDMFSAPEEASWTWRHSYCAASTDGCNFHLGAQQGCPTKVPGLGVFFVPQGVHYVSAMLSSGGYGPFWQRIETMPATWQDEMASVSHISIYWLQYPEQYSLCWHSGGIISMLCTTPGTRSGFVLLCLRSIADMQQDWGCFTYLYAAMNCKWLVSSHLSMFISHSKAIAYVENSYWIYFVQWNI